PSGPREQPPLWPICSRYTLARFIDSLRIHDLSLNLDLCLLHSRFLLPNHTYKHTQVTMADQVEGLIDVPREFVKEGIQFMNKCQKPDRKEFIKISQAIAMGFVAMGTVGYLVKLSTELDSAHHHLHVSTR
ncbi:hypothetical protein LLEC1_02026, partial [Akanthomyces lecanii]